MSALGMIGMLVLLAPETAADVVTLADGTVVRGQVIDPDARGSLVLVVRREWAEREVPEKARAWRDAERPWLKRARSERLERLRAWRRERKAAVGESGRDPILDWLDRAIQELEALGEDQGLPRLLMTAIDRREVKTVKRQPPEVGRLIRLGWRAGFADVEAMPPEDLREALRGRNLDVEGRGPVAIDDLLPTPIETEARWLARRAATEIRLDDRGARFVRYGDFVAPEGEPGQAIDATAALSGMLGSALQGELAGLGLGLGDLGGLGVATRPDADPIESRLRGLGSKGRVGAVLTRLEIAPDLAGVRVEAMLLARLGPEDWRPVARGSATVRTDMLPPDAGANIAADPQVESVFGVADALGLGISPQMKQRALAIGSATQAALGRARMALQEDLEALKLE